MQSFLVIDGSEKLVENSTRAECSTVNLWTVFIREAGKAARARRQSLSSRVTVNKASYANSPRCDTFWIPHSIPMLYPISSNSVTETP